jgi:hypothetical protein
MVIDHQRLQDAAWAEFQSVRKQLDKITRELHRHEEVDIPAYTAWLHRTFPLHVTRIRELAEEVTRKTRQILNVQSRAAHTGRSLKRLWQEERAKAADPEAFRQKAKAQPEGEAEEEASSERRKDARLEDFDQAKAPPPPLEARAIYRRLVQHLHPDRGGAWTNARERLWHEVQQAWAAGDVDWLARLEVEWETAHESIGSKTPLSRLRAAIEELHAAGRDLEHKLATYRTSLPWRFTLTEAKRVALERRVEAEFGHEFRDLRNQLTHLNRTIADWEEDWTRADSRPTRKTRPIGYFPRPRHKRKSGFNQL